MFRQSPMARGSLRQGSWNAFAGGFPRARRSGRYPAGPGRQFSSSRHQRNQESQGNRQKPGGNGKESFRSRLGAALRKTKVEWYPIPVGLGIAFLGLAQFYKSQQAEKQRMLMEAERGERPQEVVPRQRVRPTGPWQVQVMSTLPLKLVSRIWGRFNELVLPYPLRVPGFKLYSWIFGVNLDEVEEPDLHVYPNLASFFYRRLKPGVRPLDPNPSALLSPSDGRILQFGMIERGEVEQVKGMTYSLEALLGMGTASPDSEPVHPTTRPMHKVDDDTDPENLAADQEFAKMNGLSYTLPTLLSGSTKHNVDKDGSMDASTESSSTSEEKVKADLAKGEPAWYSPRPTSNRALYYVVIYLAPGDYHRFHSPASWVVESRRHFAGELYSVSPYLQRTLAGLFTLNERVVLLGRWRWGFFSFTPVGATNVGSIKINFDAELRTNSLTTDTAADRQAALAAQRGEPYSGYTEATYGHASKTLRGHALQRGEEMGGFQLGSSIVLVFEAPMGNRQSFDVSWTGEREGGWRWHIKKGQRIKYGEALGEVVV
ncbi:phosphatidylserine decarboxylase 1 [Microsporum audouinii]|uniref:Phosphatidylserine decarboxylase proenzyme 1, mitochondrial n=1 Tax=Arthroderma otae (strain ATCC MYA-4605 / CBS 113480) TaxID=554155 RepID=C5FBH1_ARTOC|nr:phosphatidylserine decarboxylase proenzyme [Microsporum canis CBS 113480]EEQ27155.1 phosphatidylserine decarboxylase proenzyme [Microsporum canis CBS 113480]